MNKRNNSRLYLTIIIVTLSAAFILGCISFYSILYVERKVKSLIGSKNNVSVNLKEAYLILRDPQLFAGYENFDSAGMAVKNSLMYFDKLAMQEEEIDASSISYLDVLLERRMLGSRLGRNTMLYFLLVASVFFAAYLYERRK